MTAEPNPDQRHLRIVECAGCEALGKQTEDMGTALLDMERDLKRHRRRIAQLEAEIAKGLVDDPSHLLAERIFEFWRVQTGRTRRTVFDVDREKAVLTGLKLLGKGYGEDLAPRALGAAIIGCARLGHTDPHTGVKHDQLTMICRNWTMIEKNLERYFQWMAQSGQTPVIEPLRSV